MRKIALGIFAHPDDAEFMCTGTLSLLKNAGWSIHIASMAQGDKGTNEFQEKKSVLSENQRLQNLLN